MRHAAASFAIGSLAAVSLLAPALASAQITCGSGEHPATAADVPLMQQAGISNAAVGMCWNPGDQAVGQSDAQAKQYLRGILCSPDADNYGGMGPDGTIQGLDSKFAVCAASFLKSAQQSGISVCIREGKRSVDKQNQYAARYQAGGPIACTKGASCEHPRGIAIDVNTSPASNYDRLHQIAPSFGLTFYLPVKDKVHFVPMRGGCSAGGTGPAGGALGPNEYIPPTYYDFPQYYTMPSIPNTSLPFSPALPFASAISPALSSAPTGSAAPSPTTAPGTTPAQNLCTPQFTCTNGTMYYQTSSCSNQVYQSCPYGCNGTVCALSASSTSSSIGSAFSIGTSTSATSSGSSSDNSSTNANPVSSIISQLTGYSFKAVDVATTAPIAFQLNPTTGDVSQQVAGKSSLVPIVGMIASNSISTVQPVSASETFTSNDLGGATAYAYSGAPTQASSLAVVLSGMASALRWALNVLKTL